MTLTTDVYRWVTESEEPWTRYRALLDLEDHPPDHPAVLDARTALLDAPQLQQLVGRASDWPGYPLKRHNDAAHPLYAVAALADFGLTKEDSQIEPIAATVLEHHDGDMFESLLWLPRFLTKDEDAEGMAWMLCDGPTLLYAMLSFGFGSHPTVERGVERLLEMTEDNGWRCGAADSLPRFSGPGRKADTCPIATTYALKVLSLVPGTAGSPGVREGIDALLSHWEHQKDYKLRMFGIGTDFRKLKYPFVWYDILHVTDVLSRFEAARPDNRFAEMVAEITGQADDDGRYTAGSMYRSWKGWSFADKQTPSPWLTMLALRVEKRAHEIGRSASG